MKNPNKLTIEEMDELAARKNGKCISREYVNGKTHLEWECEFGHRWFATPDTIKNHNSWCHVCSDYHGKGVNPKISETELFYEWDFTKNTEDPSKITTGVIKNFGGNVINVNSAMTPHLTRNNGLTVLIVAVSVHHIFITYKPNIPKKPAAF